jgi:hypothetical protein
MRRSTIAEYGIVPLRLLLILSVLFSVTSPCLAGTEYSRWTPVSGKAHIEYRWKRGESASTSCQIELRDPDDSDRVYYTGRIEYVNGGKDQTTPTGLISFLSAGETRTATTITACERVTDVWLKLFKS